MRKGVLFFLALLVGAAVLLMGHKARLSAIRTQAEHDLMKTYSEELDGTYDHDQPKAVNSALDRVRREFGKLMQFKINKVIVVWDLQMWFAEVDTTRSEGKFTEFQNGAITWRSINVRRRN